MILRDKQNNTCKCILQTDHAKLSANLLKKLTIKNHIHFYQELYYACKNHDNGWLKQPLILNPQTQYPFSFLDIPSKYHLHIWLNSQLNIPSPYAQYLILSHNLYLATRYEQHKKEIPLQINSFIQHQKITQTQLLNTLKKNKKYSLHITENKQLINQNILAFLDELSLRICIGSQEQVTLNLKQTNITLTPLSPTTYGLSPYPFKEKIIMKIPYKLFINKHLTHSINQLSYTLCSH